MLKHFPSSLFVHYEFCTVTEHNHALLFDIHSVQGIVAFSWKHWNIAWDTVAVQYVVVRIWAFCCRG